MDSLAAISFRMVAHGKEMQFRDQENEKNGQKIIANVELDSRIFKRLEATLKGDSFSASGLLGPMNQPSHNGIKPNAAANRIKTRTGK
jgi:hypothetical protein